MFKLLNSALAFCLMSIIRACFGQSQPSIDSLTVALANASKENKFEILKKLHDQYKFTDYTKALGYARDAYEKALTSGDSSKIVEGGRMMAYSLDDLGRRDEAIPILINIIGIANRNQKNYPELKGRLKNLYNNLAIAYMFLGKYDSSLSYHLKSLEIRELEKDKKSIGTSKYNIGIVYFKLRNYQKALDYYYEALAIVEELNDNNAQIKIHNNIGLCYNATKHFTKALMHFKAALNICGENCPESILKDVYWGLGRTHLVLKAYDSARVYFTNSLKFSKNQHDITFWLHNLIGLGVIERENQNYYQCLKYFNEAYDLALNSGNVESILDVYQELYTTYKLSSDYEKAFTFQEYYITLKDSIYGGTLITNLAKIQSEHEERTNLATIKAQESDLKQQKIQTMLIATIAILLLVLAILIYINYQRKVNQEQILEQKVRRRTQELEASRYELERINAEQNSLIIKTYAENRSILASAKGIYQAAVNDINDPEALDYITKMNEVTHQIENSSAVLLKKIEERKDKN